jgi:hypothetical protein
MCRSSRLLNSGCFGGILVLAVVQAVTGLAQDSKTESAPLARPAQDPAAAPPEAIRIAVQAMRVQAPDLQQVLEEQRQQYRAIMISELHFCRIACDLTDEQSRRIVTAAGVLIEEAAARAAQLELAPARRGGIRLNTDPVPPNSIKIVREALLKLVKENTAPAQQSRYQAETGKRAASWRQTAIHTLVARLDRKLILTTAQRDRLVQLFESNWNEEWGASTFSMLGDESTSFPAIPNHLIVPLLSATQQKRWKELDIQAIDATDAYINYLTGLFEGLPSEFAEGLDGAARAAGKAPVAKPGPGLEKDSRKEGSD